MSNKLILTVTGICILIIPSLSCKKSKSTLRKPNVILVMTDDQGYGDFGCHGNPNIQTPNIDRLSGQSVRLTDFHVDMICSPTRAALMTSQFAMRIGVWGTLGNHENPRAGEIMLPEVFGASGYRTAIFGKWHLGDNYPFRPGDRGFEHTLWHKGGGLCQVSDYWGNDYFNDTYYLNDKPVKYTGYCTDVWFGEAMKYIEQHRNEPFFCYIATNAPHGPCHVAEEYYNLYKDNPEVVNPEFYGMITNMDENMGRLMKRLRELKLEENTILIFMTDNGIARNAIEVDEQEFVVKGYNAGMRGTKARHYEGGLRVPFFIRWPKGGINGGRDINELTAHIDVMPTLIDLCGLQRPENNSFDGISFAPLLQGKATKMPERSIFGRTHPKKGKGTIMNGKWRLVHGEELYDIHADPGQRNDVAAQYPDVMERLLADYEAYWNEVSKRFDEPHIAIVGSDQENPVILSSMDWHGTSGVWFQPHVLSGLKKSGYWLFNVEREGTYEIALHRWPVEFDNPIVAGCPKFDREPGNRYSKGWPEGRALPIRFAQLKIGDFDQTKSVDEQATSVTFEVRLEKGETRMDTYFTDKDREMLCSAYYTSIKRKE